SPAARNPFKGLRAFNEGDSGDFHGRNGLIEIIVERLATESLLTLVGPSGCGKSSAVAAGLIPALRGGAVDRSDWWTVVRMMPGAHPFAALDVGLSRAAGGGEFLSVLESGPTGILRGVSRIVGEDGLVLLVVDQFEELFSLVEDEDRRKAFLRGLMIALDDPHSPLKVVATLRADFYGRPLEYPDFAQRFTDSVVNVLPLSVEELRSAVIEPAATVGVPVDSDLVGAIVSDVAGQPGALPLFQYSLTEMFQRRDGGPLTVAAYQRLGGLKGALVGRAERIFASFDEFEREAFRQVALRLVSVASEGEATRRRATIHELRALGIEQRTLDVVLGRFGEHRILAFDRDAFTAEPTVEVAHEALLREWGRYREWVEAGRLDLRRRAALTAGTRDWVESGSDDAYLFSGSRLEEFERWRSGTTLQLTDLEKSFLDVAARRRDDELAAQNERSRREEQLARSARRRLVAAVSLVALALVVGIVALFGFEQVPKIALYYEGEDGGINTLAANGMRRSAAEFDLELSIFQPIGTAPGFALRLAAEEVSPGGLVLVVLGGLASQVSEVAVEFSDTSFVVLDANLELAEQAGGLPNLKMVAFAAEEGSYLAGAAAALASTTGKVGFIGGVDFPLIHPFEVGFEAGARAVHEDVSVTIEYLPSSEFDFFSGFADPAGARLLAEGMYDDGVDVIYAAAGISGVGLFEAAAAHRQETGELVWAIGVDKDEYPTVRSDLRPALLTSMLKGFDVASYQVVAEWVAGDLQPGLTVAGLADGGVGLATSGGFIEEYLPRLEAHKETVVSGEIIVPNQRGDVHVDLEALFPRADDQALLSTSPRFPARIVALAVGVVLAGMVIAFLLTRWWPAAGRRSKRFAMIGVALALVSGAVALVIRDGAADRLADQRSGVLADAFELYNAGDVGGHLAYFAEGATVQTPGDAEAEVGDGVEPGMLEGNHITWSSCETAGQSLICDTVLSTTITRVAGVTIPMRGIATFDDENLIERLEYAVVDFLPIAEFEYALSTWLIETDPTLYGLTYDEVGSRRELNQQLYDRLLRAARQFVDESPLYPLTPGS
ncbi:MAG: BMP family ABC transporter substrate-binding protein, partial [Acidimicrobiia bacterium]|nr:BMP family ABC transporter substrate-binding protein [Acidimicrobiia bacterium]